MARKRRGEAINGWVIIDKPYDMGSTPVTSKIRKLFNAQKAGHGGTLDPLATGVLPIALGEATKTIPYVMDAPKEYIFEITFGQCRSTGDMAGEVIETTKFIPTAEKIIEAAQSFKGEIQQTPPIYSAIKVDGKRAYDLARAGKQVELQSRKVHLYEIESQKQVFNGHIRFKVLCSKGFYIRSLASDIAEKCGSLGYVSYLRRTACGKFSEKNAISLEKFDNLAHNDILNFLLPIEGALGDILVLCLNGEEAQNVEYGKQLNAQTIFQRQLGESASKAMEQTQEVLVKFAQKPLAIMKLDAGLLKTQRKFNM